MKQVEESVAVPNYCPTVCSANVEETCFFDGELTLSLIRFRSIAAQFRTHTPQTDFGAALSQVHAMRENLVAMRVIRGSIAASVALVTTQCAPMPKRPKSSSRCTALAHASTTLACS